MCRGLQNEEIELCNVRYFLIERDPTDNVVSLRSRNGGATLTTTNLCIIIGMFDFKNPNTKYPETGMCNLKIVEFAKKLRKNMF